MFVKHLALLQHLALSWAALHLSPRLLWRACRRMWHTCWVCQWFPLWFYVIFQPFLFLHFIYHLSIFLVSIYNTVLYCDIFYMYNIIFVLIHHHGPLSCLLLVILFLLPNSPLLPPNSDSNSLYVNTGHASPVYNFIFSTSVTLPCNSCPLAKPWF